MPDFLARSTTMLITTNLISEVEFALKLVSRWNFFPFTSPYKLYVRRSNNIYHFATNPRYINGGWRLSFIILAFAATLGVVKMKFELNFTLDAFACFFVTSATSLVAFTVLFHYRHAEDLVEFLNALITFDKRHVSLIPALSQRNWLIRQDATQFRRRSKLVALTCSFFSVAHIVESFAFPTSSALFPEAPWNNFLSLVNNFILRPVQYMMGNLTDVTIHVSRSVSVFWLYYVTTRIFMNFATINIVISLLVSNFCLNCALISFQR